MLELRDREANIRRKLYEHWASALVWEVQRLERAHTETQSSLQMDVQAAESDRNNLIDQIAAMDRGEPLPPKMMDTTELTVSQTRERSLQARLVDVESELEAERDLSSSRVKAHEVERSHDKERINELEEMVVELQKSERSWEAGAKTHDTKLRQLERERAAWLKEKTAHSQQLAALEAQLATYSGSRDVWETEKRSLVAERDTLHTERSTFDNQMREHGARSLVWVAEREGLTNERDQLAIERDRLASERDRLAAEKDVLHQAHASLEAKHAALGAKHTTDRGTWQAERERLEAVSSQQVGSRDAWQRERETLVAQNERLETDLDALAHEHDGLKKELRDMEMVRAERTALSAERDALADELLHVQDQYERARSDADAAASKSKSTLERLGATLGSVLGRSIATPELVPALDEVRVLLDRRAAELETIQARHADELQTLTQEIDVLRAKDEQGRAGSRSAQTEMTELVRKIRTQNEVIAAHEAHIAELEGRGSGLSSSRSGAGATGAGPGDRVLETKLQRLWSDLPSPKARAEAGFSHNKGITSPSTVIDFGSLHRAYEGSNDKYTNVDDLMSRVRDLVEDGRLMVDRMKRMDADNRRHKNNAELASKLVTESAAGLSKYKEQVAQFEKDIKTLQDQMASLQGRNANGARSHVELTAKITSLHTQLEQAHAENVRMREAEDAAVAQVETLSTMLATAQDHEKQTSLRLRGERDTLSRDVAELKQKLNVNSMEMMDLQNEYHDLRAENKALLAKQAR
jgi:chromosome segregation ATPase